MCPRSSIMVGVVQGVGFLGGRGGWNWSGGHRRDSPLSGTKILWYFFFFEHILTF